MGTPLVNIGLANIEKKFTNTVHKNNTIFTMLHQISVMYVQKT